MAFLSKTLIVIGKAYLWLASILLGYAAILYFEGWWRLQEIASPFNLWNAAALVITVLPGIGLIKFGEKLG